MIRPLLALLAALLSVPAAAQTARVASGEHADFTRFVVTLPGPTDWRFGRTESGYELVVPGGSEQRYDLSGVWDRIPRTRVTRLWADPEDGALNMVLACACHAFPFELQPGTIVIDVRNGPAPPGSAFETSLDGRDVPQLVDAGSTATLPRARGPERFDWLSRSEAPKGPASAQAEARLPLATGPVSLAPLRDALLIEMSRAAAEGMVDMTLPSSGGGHGARAPSNPPADLPWTHVAVGALAGVAAGTAIPSPGEMQADGEACIDDEHLDLTAWGGDGPAALRIADARAGLVGEFDIPDPDAVLRIVRHHLYLGFGAEALQYLRMLDPASPGDLDARIYASMARILDDIPDPESPFARMLGCDGAAALWSALLHDRLPASAGLNVAAILRSFQGLPPHLRQHLGPGVADRFLAAGEVAAARSVRDATTRVPDAPQATVALVDAKLHLGENRLEQAGIDAEAALEAGGAEGPEAIIALVETRFRALQPVGSDVPVTVAAFLTEAAGTSTEPALRRALILSLALAGQAIEAQAALATTPSTEPEFWRVASARVTDADLIRIAVLPETAEPPSADSQTSLAIAGRLLDLGFADDARRWLGPLASTDKAEARLLAARAELQIGDARAARDLLAGIDGPAAEATRSEVLVALGAIDPAVASARASGDLAAAERIALWARDWPKVSQAGPALWKEAAALGLASASGAEGGGLLAQGIASAEQASKVRDAVENLLAAVPDPAAAP